jgi:hypothetical protein
LLLRQSLLGEACLRSGEPGAFLGRQSERGGAGGCLGDHGRAYHRPLAQAPGFSTTRWSVRLIWREEIEPRLVSVDKTAALPELESESRESPAQTPLPVEAPPADQSESRTGTVNAEEIEPRLAYVSKTAPRPELESKSRESPAQTPLPVEAPPADPVNLRDGGKSETCFAFGRARAPRRRQKRHVCRFS